MSEIENLTGARIENVRPMSAEELEAYGWDGFSGFVIELSSGALLIPSGDEEGNAPGVLHMHEPGGRASTVFVSRVPSETGGHGEAVVKWQHG